jgi:putative methyltransferase (TIGR04325 family)
VSGYSGLRQLALLLLPPIVTNALRGARLRKSRSQVDAMQGTECVSLDARVGAKATAQLPEWEMVADADEIWESGDGWRHDSIVRTQLDKWPQFLSSFEQARVLGQSHEASRDAVPDCATHNTIMSFGYALGRVAQGQNAISVLDWGGGLGHYFVYARALFPGVTFDYVVKDFPGFCEAGRKLLPDASYVSDEAVALGRKYDLVFASSSLHYSRKKYEVLDRLCACATWLMITRMPIVEESDDFVVIQRPHVYGYMTEYPGWFINRRRLLDFVVARGFVLERQLLVGEQPNVPNAKERAQYYGFLFRRGETASGAQV